MTVDLSAINASPEFTADFKSAVALLLNREGGLENNPYDSGGVTNYGISLAFLVSLGAADLATLNIASPITADTIRSMTPLLAARIYKLVFWDRTGFSTIWYGSKLMDIAVDAGVASAVMVLQRALRACGCQVADDGVLGPATLAALATVSGPDAEGHDCVRVALRSEAAAHYRIIAALHPSQNQFLAGWLNRAYDD